jgi:7-cyano-7-deazaguanine synthase
MYVSNGHYEEENIKSTVVPNLNMILISIVIGYAVDIKDEGDWYADNSGYHMIYLDCRPEFVKIWTKLQKQQIFQPVYFHAPHLYVDKIGILKDGILIGLGYSMNIALYTPLTITIELNNKSNYC